jgi:anti-sigma factor RsiW
VDYPLPPRSFAALLRADRPLPVTRRALLQSAAVALLVAGGGAIAGCAPRGAPLKTAPPQPFFDDGSGLVP